MSTYQFILEGKEDIKFLQDMIANLGIVDKNLKFEYSGGWSKVQLPAVVNKLKENTLRKGRNILIFDADDNIEERRRYLEKQRDLLKIEFDYFLLPNNNDIGNLETILLSIANPAHNSIFDCFDAYCMCISDNYSVPDTKDKIFGYLDALCKETLAEKRDFLDTDCWNIAHPNLDNLRNFLLQIFKS